MKNKNLLSFQKGNAKLSPDTLLFSIPLVLSFCGEWGRGIVSDGFEALAGMPQWYQISLGSIVAASFATRSAKKFFNPVGKKK